MSCPCDIIVVPADRLPPRIDAGLSSLPRQIGIFPDFRRALLNSIRSHSALQDWEAESLKDFGLMWMEMWAYACDVVSFYDGVVAQEVYLRTGHLQPSERKLLGLLGYLPGPAVGASALVAFIASGKKSLVVPAGTAFRSGAFDGEAPQVFELSETIEVHPPATHLGVERERTGTFGDEPMRILLEPRDASDLSAGDIVLVLRSLATGESGYPRYVDSAEQFGAEDDELYVDLRVDESLPFASSTLVEELAVYRAARTAALWPNALSGDPEVYRTESGVTRLILDTVYRRIKTNSLIVVEYAGELRWGRVVAVREVPMTTKPGQTVTVPAVDSAGDPVIDPVTGIAIEAELTSPPATSMATELELDADLNAAPRGSATTWNASMVAEMTIHYGLSAAGTITSPYSDVIDFGQPLVLEGSIRQLAGSPAAGQRLQLLIEDDREVGYAAFGALAADASAIILDAGTTFDPEPTAPITLFGSVGAATRGETVVDEVLGSGDASQINQCFTLKKSPLTYLPSPTTSSANGLEPELEVRVDRITWNSVPTFFNVGPDETVYTVRQNDDQESIICFGDGIRGKRLTTGADNVTATYRFGAGAAAPPASSISQLVAPVMGISAVRNLTAATGGQDTESDLRVYGPRSALVLGRAVSLADLEATAASAPGVRNVRAGWAWIRRRQRPMAVVWYVGDEALEDSIQERLRSVSAPSTPIDVVHASPREAHMVLDLRIDPAHLAEDVTAEVEALLIEDEVGLLVPEVFGIGRPLIRSQISAWAMSVAGVSAVLRIRLDGAEMTELGAAIEPGRYWDFQNAGSLVAVPEVANSG